MTIDMYHRFVINGKAGSSNCNLKLRRQPIVQSQQIPKIALDLWTMHLGSAFMHTRELPICVFHANISGIDCCLARYEGTEMEAAIGMWRKGER